jgi:hypothetical protein
MSRQPARRQAARQPPLAEPLPPSPRPCSPPLRLPSAPHPAGGCGGVLWVLWRAARPCWGCRGRPPTLLQSRAPHPPPPGLARAAPFAGLGCSSTACVPGIERGRGAVFIVFVRAPGTLSPHFISLQGVLVGAGSLVVWSVRLLLLVVVAPSGTSARLPGGGAPAAVGCTPQDPPPPPSPGRAPRRPRRPPTWRCTAQHMCMHPARSGPAAELLPALPTPQASACPSHLCHILAAKSAVQERESVCTPAAAAPLAAPPPCLCAPPRSLFMP